MPELWSAIVFHLPEELEMLAFARSQSMPLDGCIRSAKEWHMRRANDDARDSVYSRLVPLAIHHALRLRSITACNFTEVEYGDIFASQMPLLEELYLYETDPRSTVEKSTRVDAPHLRYATLHGRTTQCLFGSSGSRGLSFDFPSLRMLHVALSGSCIGSPELGWYADILQSSPLIEDLKLALWDSHGGIPWDAFLNGHGRSVQLQRLQSLELIGTYTTDMAGFYKHIRPARPVRFLATLRRPLYSDENMLKFATGLGSMLQHPSHNGLLVRVMTDWDGLSLEITLFPALENHARYCYVNSFIPNMPEVIHLNIALPYHTPTDSPLHQKTANVIAASLGKNKITQLIIDAPALEEWPFVIESVISVCPDVHELVICCPFTGSVDTFPIFDMLTSTKALPSLETLFIRPVIFHSSADRVYHWEGELAEWLKWRAQAALRVKSLHLLLAHHRVDVAKEDQWNRRSAIRSSVAEFVDEIYDERGDSFK